jgi:hypothetical protein
MSEDKPKDEIKSEAVIKTTLERIKAFGYVDRAWILSAFETYFWDVYKPNAKDERKGPHPMVWVVLAPLMPLIWLAKLISYPFRQSDIDRSQNPMAKRDPRDKRAFQVNAGLLRSLLNTIPLPSTGLPAHGGRRRGPGARSLESLLKTADAKNLKRIAKFLRKSGLEETGFPVRLVGEKGEGAPKAKADDAPSTPMQRSAALSVLTGGLLYRFAYDHDKKLQWEDTKRVFRAAGLYRVYVVPPDATYVERRLLLMSLNKDGAIVRAAEIRKRRGQFVVRGGYVIPASGINTFVLSSDFSPDVLAEMIEEGISPAARDIVFPEGVPDEVETSASFLQEHQLGFYSLFSRGEGELRGSLMEAPTPATAVGYRVEESQIDLSDPPDERVSLPTPPGDALSDAPEAPRRRHPELGFLTLDEIEDRRDQILVAAVSRNPAVSIDIG